MVATLLAGAMLAAPVHAATVEVLPNYSPVRAPDGAGGFLYASPSFAAYRDNVMQGLISGQTSFGPQGSPTRFEAFERNIYRVVETTGTPFNSWLGDTTPEGAFAGEYGTIIRAAVRVESETAFTIDDVFYRYSDDIGNDFGATFADLGFRFGATFVGRTADGSLLSSAGDDPLQAIVALYFFGFANINVIERQTPADFFASGETTDEFFARINSLYVGHPYSFTDSYELILGGVTVASDALRGDIIAGIPEPASWALMIAGFGMIGQSLRRRGQSVAARA